MIRVVSSCRCAATTVKWAARVTTGRGVLSFHSSLPLCKDLPPGPEPGSSIPIGITKDGQDPVVKEDSEYPEWLFEIGVEDGETTEEMLAKGLKNLSYTETKRLFRMLRRDKIRKANAAARKVG